MHSRPRIAYDSCIPHTAQHYWVTVAHDKLVELVMFLS